MGEVKNTAIAETNFDSIVYEKGSSALKQMFYFIGDEIFSKGPKSYFEKHKWGNTVLDDFIDQMMEASDVKLHDLRDLCNNWLKNTGLTECELFMDIDAEGNISKFNVNQIPCREDHPNLQTHMVNLF